MGLRDRRLESDLKAVARIGSPGGPIEIVEVGGTPADRYRLRYVVPGLVVQDGEVIPIASHLVEVHLTLGYPRQAPQCRMLTPIFHPNIAPHAICVGDHWSAGESLAALLVRIAEMICYQSYNVKSPLNGDAARWVETHAADLPLDRTDFSPLLTRHVGEEVPLPEGVRRAEAAPVAAIETAPPVQEIEAPPVIVPPPRPFAPSASATPAPPALSGPLPGSLTCAACGATLSLSLSWASRWARCPVCGQMLTLGG